ncbi:MAG: hypothetical protein WCT32_01280 [Patescibacteria group bacterium]|jgi:hypothetical protein
MYNKVSKLRYKRLRHVLAMPFILGMVVPIAILDICIEVYHHAAFPLYGIPLIKRSYYIKIDRQKLSYLSFVDKIWCTYCGYANGFMPYATRIAGETEKYWCAIKHRDSGGHTPPHHETFLEYNDKESYEKFINQDKSSKSSSV